MAFDLNKALEQLDEIKSSESIEDYLNNHQEEIYEILKEKSDSLIEDGVSNLEEQLMDCFIEIIEEKAHGREDAILSIYMITDGANGVDFEKNLKIPEDSVVCDKLSKGIEAYKKITECKETLETGYKWYNNFKDLKKLQNEDGTFGREGKKQLEKILYDFIDDSSSIIDKIPAAGLYGKAMSAMLGVVRDMLPGTIAAARAHNDLTELDSLYGDYAVSNDPEDAEIAYRLEMFLEDNRYIDWTKDYSNSELEKTFKDGPTYDQMIKIYQDHPGCDLFDEYIEWRYAYECSEALKAYKNKLLQKERMRELRMSEQYLDATFLDIQQFMIENIIDTDKSYRNNLSTLESAKENASLNSDIAKIKLEEYKTNSNVSQAEYDAQKLVVKQAENEFIQAETNVLKAQTTYSEQINSSLSEINGNISQIDAQLEMM